MKKELKKIAHKLVQLEKKASNDNRNQNDILDEMMSLTQGLSLQDMIQIDCYIQEKNLLTN